MRSCQHCGEQDRPTFEVWPGRFLCEECMRGRQPMDPEVLKVAYAAKSNPDVYRSKGTSIFAVPPGVEPPPFPDITLYPLPDGVYNQYGTKGQELAFVPLHIAFPEAAGIRDYPITDDELLDAGYSREEVRQLKEKT